MSVGEPAAPPEVEWLPEPAPAGEDAPVPPTAGERAFVRYLVRRAIERRRKARKVA